MENKALEKRVLALRRRARRCTNRLERDIFDQFISWLKSSGEQTRLVRVPFKVNARRPIVDRLFEGEFLNLLKKTAKEFGYSFVTEFNEGRKWFIELWRSFTEEDSEEVEPA